MSRFPVHLYWKASSLALEDTWCPVPFMGGNGGRVGRQFCADACPITLPQECDGSCYFSRTQRTFAPCSHPVVKSCECANANPEIVALAEQWLIDKEAEDQRFDKIEKRCARYVSLVYGRGWEI